MTRTAPKERVLGEIETHNRSNRNSGEDHVTAHWRTRGTLPQLSLAWEADPRAQNIRLTACQTTWPQPFGAERQAVSPLPERLDRPEPGEQTN